MNMDDVVKLGGKPRWYGPGIAAIKISNYDLYNFYGVDFPAGDIHNHRGDLSSTVIKGGLRNIIYDVVPKKGGEWTQYRTRCLNNCEAARNFCTNFEVIEPEVNLVETIYFDSREGDTYFINSQQIHAVNLLSPYVITHIRFSEETQYAPTSIRPRVGKPCIFGKGSGRDDSESETAPNIEEIWSIIEEVVKNS